MWHGLNYLCASASVKSLSSISIRPRSKPTLNTRDSLPGDEPHTPTDDFPGLLRAADLIGQLADINYLRKTAALFNEFRKTGTSKILKYNSAADLRANYPQFFWKVVTPYIGDASRDLLVTQEGQQWVANLYANVFATEHIGQIG